MRHPCPRSWLRHPSLETVEVSLSQAALAGRAPKPGTKARLHMQLVASGWDRDVLTLTKQVEKAFALLVPGDDGTEVSTLATKLRAEGLPVEVGTTQTYPNWLWLALDAVTRHAWWTPCRHVKESIVLLAKNKTAAKTASASIVLALHENLHGEQHVPSFLRTSLTTLASPQTLQDFLERNASRIDLLVLSDGALDVDSVYQTFSVLAAIRETFDGLLIYEATPHDWNEREYVANVARRAGFPLVVGVGNGGRGRGGVRGQPTR